MSDYLNLSKELENKTKLIEAKSFKKLALFTKYAKITSGTLLPIHTILPHQRCIITERAGLTRLNCTKKRSSLVNFVYEC